jgi:exopolysaccharide biosynthesis polyprenyl glycosylphosphotransferase
MAVDQRSLPRPKPFEEFLPETLVERPLSEWGDVLDERTVEIINHRRRLGVRRPRGWLIRRMLLLADVIALAAAFGTIEVLLGSGGGQRNQLDLQSEALLFMLTIPGWVVVSKLYGLYDRDEERADHSTADDLVGVFHLATVGTWLLLLASWATGVADADIARLASFWATAVVFITLARAAARAISRRQLAYVQNTVIMGSGRLAQLVAQKFRQHPEYGINVVGFVDDDAPRANGDGVPRLLGPLSSLRQLVAALNVERVVVAFPTANMPDEYVELVRDVEELNVQVDIVPRLHQLFGPGVSIHTVEGIPLLALPPIRLSRSSMLLKHAFDLALTVPALILLAPVFAVIAFAIKLDSRGAVLFRQTRVGYRDRMFTIYKFRTMVADADRRKGEVAHLNKHAREGGDPRMFKIAGDPRTTRLGRFLRRYSLDELPQLFNVVRGEMSLVGPRPLIPEEARHVERWARKRLEIKPGVTGQWQVLGRSAIPFEEMVSLDYLYVTRWSLFNDLKLILRTIPALVRPRDAY